MTSVPPTVGSWEMTSGKVSSSWEEIQHCSSESSSPVSDIFFKAISNYSESCFPSLTLPHSINANAKSWIFRGRSHDAANGDTLHHENHLTRAGDGRLWLTFRNFPRIFHQRSQVFEFPPLEGKTVRKYFVIGLSRNGERPKISANRANVPETIFINRCAVALNDGWRLEGSVRGTVKKLFFEIFLDIKF